MRDKRKLRSQFGEVTEQSFALQVVEGNKIQTVNLGFDEVKSVKVPGKRGNAVGKAVAYGLAGMGAFFVTLFVVCVASGCGD